MSSSKAATNVHSPMADDVSDASFSADSNTLGPYIQIPADYHINGTLTSSKAALLHLIVCIYAREI